MIARFASGLKITCFTLLFFAPLVAAQWNMSLEQWERANHRWEALPMPEISPTDLFDSSTPDFSQIDDQAWEDAD